MADQQLTLESVYRHEREWAHLHHMTQPMAAGCVQNYSWSRTVGEARRVAAYLRSLELREPSSIAIISKNCAEFVIAELAIWMAGHVSVALFPTLSPEGMAFILEHSEAQLVFIGKLDDGAAVQRAIPAALARISFSLAPAGTSGMSWKSILAEWPPIGDSPVRPAADIAMIIYTSGSTGRPKGAMHSFGGIAAAGQALIRSAHVTRQDRMLSYLPLAHVMDRFCCETTSLLAGVQLFFVESMDTFAEDLKRARPSVFVSVPRLWLRFQVGVSRRLPPEKLRRLLGVPLLGRMVRKQVLRGLGLHCARFAVSSAAPIPGELIQWYRDLGLELHEAYGMTENFACSHVSLPGESRIGYVGRPLAGVQCRISAEGEVLVKSPGTMLGYFKEPELSRECFTTDGFLKTGDRGEMDAGGRLKLTGRLKELFKTSKGKYVAPAPIENLINAHAGIEMSCVLGSGQVGAFAVINLADDVHTQTCGAPRAKLIRELEAVLTTVNAQVEEHEKLRFLVVAQKAWSIGAGQLTPSLKLKRDAIEQAVSPQLESWYRSGANVIWEAASL